VTDRLHRHIEWPLWSWKHLGATVAGILVLVALIGKAASALSPEADPTHTKVAGLPVVTSPSPLPTSPEATVPQPSPSSSSGVAATSPAPIGPCEQVVARFAAEWATTSRPAAEWLTALKDKATPAFVTQLEKVDPARVPASQVLGTPQEVAPGVSPRTFRVVTDGGRIDIATEKTGDSCLVSGLEPAENIAGAPIPALTQMPPTAAGG